MQIFVISDGTNTRYYSNNLRLKITDNKDNTKSQKNNNSKSFAFTSCWADGKNTHITDIVDFTKTFFSKRTLLNILIKYCVFTSEKKLLVMRPYQIYATEQIIKRIQTATNYKKYGSINGGGYIWHTTGSGKTLTSFKTAQLTSALDYIDKVIFVVDRKDLDYQTVLEYNNYQKDSVDSSYSTQALIKHLEKTDEKAKVVVTTIQKLYTLIRKNKKHDIYNKHVVIIFDECHRSQFGDMHRQITKSFKKYHIFGFTGTPIFKENANSEFFTTDQMFGDRLHTYTIVDAINDNNVLPFKVEYWDAINNIRLNVNREEDYTHPGRIRAITKYILEHFNKKTYRNDSKSEYTIKFLENVKDIVKMKIKSREDLKTMNKVKSKIEKELKGFNSIFAVSSIDMAKAYYKTFKEQQEALRPEERLRIAMIYSYAPNGDDNDCQFDEENPESTTSLNQSDRDFLGNAIQDYNKMFRSNYSTGDKDFQKFYKDISLRMKNREIDLLIVVNMFLTGFDAPTLNTLWVDKDLKMHGLIQTFSRTNRILDDVKKYGNIVCFRDLRKDVNDAIGLFGNEKASGIILIRSYKEIFFDGYTDANGVKHPSFLEIVDQLKTEFPLSEPSIIGEQRQKDFINLVGQFLRVRNILKSFDEFEDDEQKVLSERDIQNYTGKYIDLKHEWEKRYKTGELTCIDSSIIFELELVEQIEVDVDYILNLVAKYNKKNCVNKEDTLSDIYIAINASPTLRGKKKLIDAFIANLDNIDDVFVGWNNFVLDQKKKMLNEIIEEEQLKPDETRMFIEAAFNPPREIITTGSDFDKLLPPCSRFSIINNRAEKKQRVADKLVEFFNMFVDI